jgi:hypothetical protein
VDKNTHNHSRSPSPANIEEVVNIHARRTTSKEDQLGVMTCSKWKLITLETGIATNSLRLHVQQQLSKPAHVNNASTKAFAQNCAKPCPLDPHRRRLERLQYPSE